MPKALPQVTPDSQNHLNTGQHNQGYQANRYQNHHNRGQAIKRRHSGKDGKHSKWSTINDVTQIFQFFKFFYPLPSHPHHGKMDLNKK